MKVIKRDGREVEFDKYKIIKAMENAFTEVDGKLNEESLGKICNIATSIENNRKSKLTVEEIQDMIEEKLMASNRKDVAKAYVRFRYKRELVREAQTNLDYEILGVKDGTSEETINNANKNGKLLQTLKPMIADVTVIDQAKRFFIPQNILKHHEKEIYIHDMNYFGLPMHNCFEGNTEFVTNKGVRKFNEFYDGDTVVVRDKDGVWREATVKKYGKQKMFDVTLKTQKSEKKVTVTKNHRWILKNGEVTTDLKVGDTLINLPYVADYVPITLEEKEYFCFGFIIGDGTDIYNSNGVKCVLCGHKTEYLHYFTECGYNYNELKNGNIEVSNKKTFKKQEFLNNCAWRYLSSDCKNALFHGLMLADKTVGRNNIATTDIRELEMIKEISCISGYYITSINESVRNTNYKNNSTLYTIYFITDQKNNWCWKVTDIVPHKVLDGHQREITAWCVEEPITHSFTLNGGIVTGNCMLINWEDMLENGMVIGNAPIEKPSTITVVINLLSQIVAHVSSNCYGGVTLINLTKGLCQYGQGSLNQWRQIGKDNNVPNVEDFAWKMLEREIKKAIRGLEYEILTLTNSRGEIPFCTFELDCIDLDASDEEQRIQHMIITNMLQVRIEGLTGGITPVFPKLCFEVKRGNNLEPTDKYYDVFQLAIKCSSIRLYPDYLMHDKLVEVTGGYKAPMSCRSFIPELSDENGNRIVGGGFNTGVCSVNLPRIAILADHNEDKFYELLHQYLDMARDVLLIRRDMMKNVKAKQSPILYQYGGIARLDPEETIEKLLYKNRSTVSIGYVGVHNALIALYGESYDTNRDMIDKGIKMVQYMKDYCQKLKNETNIGFSLYSTPAETLATKFCRSDVKEFGLIKGVNDKGYYENSFHYPSNEYIVAFDKIDIESNMSKLATGGAIQYVEFGNMTHNPKALEQIVRYAYDKCHYFGVNVSSDRCFKCGYVGEMETIDDTTNHFRCPQCGNEDNSTMSVIRRLCGYLGSLSERPTVDGKMKEMAHRVKSVKTSCGE